MENTFVEVLRLCAAVGLVSVGTIAIDGTKMGADAALDVNRGRAAIEAERQRLRAEVEAMLVEARTTDEAEDAQQRLFGLDRLPVELATRAGRLDRLGEALASIEAADAAQDAATEQRAAQARAAAAEGRKLKGRKPKDPRANRAQAEAEVEAVTTRVESAQARRVEARAAKQARAASRGHKLTGPAPTGGLRQRERRDLEQAEQRLARARAAPVTPRDANLTDPDSRIMKTAAGWVQGYNAQAAVNEHQVVVACGVSQDANDVHQYAPMVAATQAALAAVGIDQPIGTVLADAGYWSDANATAEGPDRLIATQKDHKQRRAAREMGTTTGPPPEGASALEAMEHRLRTPEGTKAYARRSHTVEPVFADAKHNRGWRRFRRRGLERGPERVGADDPEPQHRQALRPPDLGPHAGLSAHRRALDPCRFGSGPAQSSAHRPSGGSAPGYRPSSLEDAFSPTAAILRQPACGVYRTVTSSARARNR